MEQAAPLSNRQGNKPGRGHDHYRRAPEAGVNRNTVNRDALILTACALFLIILGGAFGWVLRSATVSDRYLMSTAQYYFAQRDYYNHQADAIIEQGVQIKQKESTTNGKKKN